MCTFFLKHKFTPVICDTITNTTTLRHIIMLSFFVKLQRSRQCSIIFTFVTRVSYYFMQFFLVVLQRPRIPRNVITQITRIPNSFVLDNFFYLDPYFLVWADIFGYLAKSKFNPFEEQQELQEVSKFPIEIFQNLKASLKSELLYF